MASILTMLAKCTEDLRSHHLSISLRSILRAPRRPMKINANHWHWLVHWNDNVVLRWTSLSRIPLFSVLPRIQIPTKREHKSTSRNDWGNFFTTVQGVLHVVQSFLFSFTWARIGCTPPVISYTSFSISRFLYERRMVFTWPFRHGEQGTSLLKSRQVYRIPNFIGKPLHLSRSKYSSSHPLPTRRSAQYVNQFIHIIGEFIVPLHCITSDPRSSSMAIHSPSSSVGRNLKPRLQGYIIKQI